MEHHLLLTIRCGVFTKILACIPVVTALVQLLQPCHSQCTLGARDFSCSCTVSSFRQCCLWCCSIELLFVCAVLQYHLALRYAVFHPLSLRASSPIWASKASLARTCEQATKTQRAPRSRVLARLTLLAQIGELARRLHPFGRL